MNWHLDYCYCSYAEHLKSPHVVVSSDKKLSGCHSKIQLYFAAAYTVMALALLVMKAMRTRVGGVVSLLTLLYVILCEFMVPAERWHNVRGAQMVLSMKGLSMIIIS